MGRETGKLKELSRTPTPVKEVINNEFGKKYEDQLMKNYEKILNEVK
jgi:hypothetical protein